MLAPQQTSRFLINFKRPVGKKNFFTLSIECISLYHQEEAGPQGAGEIDAPKGFLGYLYNVDSKWAISSHSLSGYGDRGSDSSMSSLRSVEVPAGG